MYIINFPSSLLNETTLLTFRTYALRRVKDGFRENIAVDNPKALDVLLNQARESLAVIKRQVRHCFFLISCYFAINTVGFMYGWGTLFRYLLFGCFFASIW